MSDQEMPPERQNQARMERVLQVAEGEPVEPMAVIHLPEGAIRQWRRVGALAGAASDRWDEYTGSDRAWDSMVRNTRHETRVLVTHPLEPEGAREALEKIVEQAALAGYTGQIITIARDWLTAHPEASPPAEERRKSETDLRQPDFDPLDRAPIPPERRASPAVTERGEPKP